MRYISLLLFLFILTSCGNDNVAVEQATEDASLAAQESAYSTLMDAHDRIMPEMGKVTAAQRAILEQLKEEGLSEERRDLLTSLNEQLEDAHDSMMDWMSDIEPLDELRADKDHEEIISHLKEETGEIASVETKIKAALAAANNVLEGDHAHPHMEGEDHDHDH